jgi:hypothetical protein
MDEQTPQFQQVPHQLETPVSAPPPKPRNRNLFILLLLLLAAIVVAVGTWFIMKKDKPKINSFAECKAAGNPIAESYPEQCFADGQSFTNPDQQPLTQDEQQELSDLGAAAQRDQQQAQYDATWMDIDEWGVKIPRGDKLPYAHYELSSQNTVAKLSSNDFTMTDCSTQGGGIANIVRFQENESDTESGKKFKDIYTDAKKVGEYYYGFIKSETGNTCIEYNTNRQIDPSTFLTAFKEAAANIQSK